MLPQCLRVLFFGVLAWLALMPGQAPAASGGPLRVLSTQFGTVTEAKAFRDDVLAGFGSPVAFTSATRSARIFESLAKAKAVDLLIARCGELADLRVRGALKTLADALGPEAGHFNEAGDTSPCGRSRAAATSALPWLHASYVMVAHRDALAYLPPGASLETLTMVQLTDWADALQERTGAARLGFPAGPHGLMHRFIQGYLYPAYTGGLVTTFQSAAAELMWRDLSTLWRHVVPHSLAYDAMTEPLLHREVWIGFDHVARLRPLLLAQPDDWVVFRPPAGPAGGAFLDVTIALAVPNKSRDAGRTRALVRFLRRPRIESLIAARTGFLPLERDVPGLSLPPGLARAAAVLYDQRRDRRVIRGTLPTGLSAAEADFNTVFKVAFTEIVLDGEDIPSTLRRQSALLDEILHRTQARCWPPDPPGDDPCRVGPL